MIIHDDQNQLKYILKYVSEFIYLIIYKEELQYLQYDVLDCVIIHTEEDSAYLEMETTPNHCLVEENMSHLHVLCDSEENIIHIN